MATEITAAGVITGSLQGLTSAVQVRTDSLEEQTTIASTSITLEGAQAGPALETSESTAESLEGVGAATDSTTEASYLPVGTSGTTSTVVLTSAALGSTATVFLTATSPFIALSNSLDTPGATTLPFSSATPRSSSVSAIGALVGILIGAIVVAVLVGLFIYLCIKRRRHRPDRAPTIVPANAADEPEMEQPDLPSGRLRYFDEGPIPPTFNSS